MLLIVIKKQGKRIKEEGRKGGRGKTERGKKKERKEGKERGREGEGEGRKKEKGRKYCQRALSQTPGPASFIGEFLEEIHLRNR